MRVKKKYAITVLIMVCLIFPVISNAKSDPIPMVPATFATLAQDAKPSVVNIQTVKNIKGDTRMYEQYFGQPFGNNREMFEHFFGPFFNQRPQDRKEESLGSGFIISESGYIVTNYHVIKGADQIKVVLSDKKEYEASVIGTDPMTDIALIKIKADNLIPLTLGVSKDTPVGSWVVAIGSPFGLEQTVTAGIISAKGRIIGSGPFDDFIQTDASINPGNSGGPLLNMNGEVIGINTAIIRSGQGIGFAIPSDLAKGIIEQLTDHKSVERGWLGVSILNFEKQEKSDDKGPKGVFVDKVFKGEPADKAGIQSGDIIVKVNDKEIESIRDLQFTIAGSAVGDWVKVLLIRDGKEKTIKVKLGQRSDKDPEVIAQNNGYDEFGFRLKTLDHETAQKLGYPENIEGLVVLDVDPSSPGAKTMVRHGDILIKINQTPITDTNGYNQTLKTIEKGQVVQFLFRRGNSHVFRISMTKP
ncbi:MAG: Do family serine endopeptidase [Pseudomonadota bacterium]